jgi:hypothetical protein
MAEVRTAQLRLIYSLLRPAVRVAARFHVPVRTLSDLLRMAYFESLQREGLTQAEIAQRMSQTERHMRSLARRLKQDFFAAEQEVGTVREVENLVAEHRPRPEDVPGLLKALDASVVEHALRTLEEDGRIETAADGRLQAAARYVVLSSEHFHHRIDALNHFLEGAYRAALQCLVFDDRKVARLKTISFTALPSSLVPFIERFEGSLRRDVAELEEEAQFAGSEEHRYTLGICLASFDE